MFDWPLMQDSKNLEFKRDLSLPKHLLKTLVAFANIVSGRLVIGISNDRQIIRNFKSPQRGGALVQPNCGQYFALPSTQILRATVTKNGGRRIYANINQGNTCASSSF